MMQGAQNKHASPRNATAVANPGNRKPLHHHQQQQQKHYAGISRSIQRDQFIKHGTKRCPAYKRSTVITSATMSQQEASSKTSEFDDFVDYIVSLQQQILSGAEQLDGSGKTFVRDAWQRDASDPNAGWGATCVLEGGRVLEKAAANTTVVRGKLSAARAQAMSSRGRGEIDPAGGQEYAAAAMSLVFHSAHPHVPTLRADVRLFQVAGKSWYGGGCDITPFYLNEKDATSFHAYWKKVCDKYQPDLYPRLKEWCDKAWLGSGLGILWNQGEKFAEAQQQQELEREHKAEKAHQKKSLNKQEASPTYFYIPARKEHRGLGGLFFDDLTSSECGFDAAAFTRDVGAGILPSWQDIARTGSALPFTEAQRDWQLLRRGRYLEFNLLYDRGVKFGLDGGRIESIMVSAPPLIAWRYNIQPQPGSEEAKLEAVLQQPRNWV